MKYAMTEQEVVERFHDNMDWDKLAGMTRARANQHMQEIMYKAKQYRAKRTPPSLISTFKRRMASFIIR
jgi:hypothetical protein